MNCNDIIECLEAKMSCDEIMDSLRAKMNCVLEGQDVPVWKTLTAEEIETLDDDKAEKFYSRCLVLMCEAMRLMAALRGYPELEMAKLTQAITQLYPGLVSALLPHSIPPETDVEADLVIQRIMRMLIRDVYEKLDVVDTT